jgi:hypothetical protein
MMAAAVDPHCGWRLRDGSIQIIWTTLLSNLFMLLFRKRCPQLPQRQRVQSS